MLVFCRRAREHLSKTDVVERYWDFAKAFDKCPDLSFLKKTKQLSCPILSCGLMTGKKQEHRFHTEAKVAMVSYGSPCSLISS